MRRTVTLDEHQLQETFNALLYRQHWLGRMIRDEHDPQERSQLSADLAATVTALDVLQTAATGREP